MPVASTPTPAAPAGGPNRRQLLAAGLSLAAAGPALAQSAAPAGYPNKPVRLIVPFPPGGGNDVIARVVGQKLGERLGQSVVIDNRGGGNGTIGLAALAQSAPDGYTLAVGAAGPMAVNPSLYEKLPYDPLRDFASITNMVNFPLLLVTHPSVPARTVRDLVELAKARPNALFYASPGSGNSGHLAGELFNSMAKVSITHVPYKGQGPALADLLAGQVQMLYSSIPSVMQHVQQGRLNAIAVGSAQRIASLPNVPTIAETIPGYEAYSWVGMVAPKGTPREIVARLHREIVDILKQKDVEDKLVGEGAIPVGDTPEQFAAYIAAEITKWGAVVKSANIKAD
ncbi:MULTISPECIES: Bug family tripartite tricarboxylate transporter substrate binding protein [Ramlibacter]|uniref:Tripartite tricarboxylate transporter substrate binding protein n=1 Tax=Ramlibacter pinisoli TaxID=2682844 RepID=A0A6N8IY37_9BURK|nr:MULTISPECIES: tripartite tricarboxylate transporter substrate binding protein [Ramlibacter]MBA2961978.1 tripartite tricarboxylate transporter substrate binding protein [Ramlibacter sp. CGMCC 1.13660]MVQ31921.1 tripartite tricarboxylate transporter substrate binding protein [Ramlibacter pinisoli]